jgi:hypothetical protein
LLGPRRKLPKQSVTRCRSLRDFPRTVLRRRVDMIGRAAQIRGGQLHGGAGRNLDEEAVTGVPSLGKRL